MDARHNRPDGTYYFNKFYKLSACHDNEARSEMSLLADRNEYRHRHRARHVETAEVAQTLSDLSGAAQTQQHGCERYSVVMQHAYSHDGDCRDAMQELCQKAEKLPGVSLTHWPWQGFSL